jgi:hypothetical protein
MHENPERDTDRVRVVRDRGPFLVLVCHERYFESLIVNTIDLLGAYEKYEKGGGKDVKRGLSTWFCWNCLCQVDRACLCRVFP